MNTYKELVKKMAKLYKEKQYKHLLLSCKDVLEDKHSSDKEKSMGYLFLSFIESESNFNYEKAYGLAKKAYALNPDDVNINNAMGTHYSAIGDRQAAEACLRKVLDQMPSHCMAWYNLSGIKKFIDKEDTDILKIHELINKKISKKDEEDLHLLYFSLGKAYGDLGEYEASMKYYFQANFCKKIHFNSFESEVSSRRIQEIFSKEYIEQHQLDVIDRDLTPIFILGMPRSGSSLLEHVLTSHSKVATVGEGCGFEKIINRFPRRFDSFNDIYTSFNSLKKETLEKAVEEYLALIKKVAVQGEKFILNKTPANYLYIGLIKMMFPNAKVIHTQRHPGDTCLSCFFANFGVGNAYAFDPTFVGYYYRSYTQFMQHWGEVVDRDFIYDCRYESFVQKPQENISQLLAFIGLEEEAACFEHEKNQRYIATASRMQVNQPIYTTSIGRWQHYQPWLHSLMNIDDLIETYESQSA